MKVDSQAVIDGYARLCAHLQGRVICLEAALAARGSESESAPSGWWEGAGMPEDRGSPIER